VSGEGDRVVPDGGDRDGAARDRAGRDDWDEEERAGAGLMSGFGWVDEDELQRVVVVSPHLDDAVLGCGQFLAAHPGTTVVTVFAGIPDEYPDPPGWWSRLSGFGPGDDIMAARREEDRRALQSLGATPHWLDFLESMFVEDGAVARAADIAAALAAVLEELAPTLVLVPLGLANPEHVVTHDAALAARRDLEGTRSCAWIAYEELGYDHVPGQLAWRITKLFRSSLWPTPVAMPVDPDPARKRAALDRYPTQMRALEADWHLSRRLDAPASEHYWRLEPPPPGWEAMIELA
jgi:LmbE family N-acetylglucosaminyl deacetylase